MENIFSLFFNVLNYLSDKSYQEQRALNWTNLLGFVPCLTSMCTEFARIERTARMATIVRTKQGTWRAQVRRKGKYASRTFRLKTLASEWVSETERLIDMGCGQRSI